MSRDSAQPGQLAFQFWQPSALAELEKRLAAAIDRGLQRRKDMSRDQVADLLSLWLHRKVNRGHIDNWLAPSKENYRIPADVIVALCQILNTDEPLQVLAAALGGRALFGPDLARADLAHLEDQRARLAKEINRRRRTMETEGSL